MRYWTPFLLLFVAVIGFSSCDGDMDILDEDKEAPIRLSNPVINEVRRGPELGLRIRTRLTGYGAGNPPCVIRCTVKDENDIVLDNPTMLETRQVSQHLDSLGVSETHIDSTFVTEKAILFGWPLGNGNDPVVEVFIPYHYLKLVSGDQEVRMELEVLEGEIPDLDHNDLPMVIRECKDLRRVGYKKIAYRFYYPDLHSIRIWVQSFALDTTKFDPHTSDFSLFKLRSDHGYPDVCWTLGVDYEIVFQSDHFKNSLEGNWNAPSDPIYVDGLTEKVRVCVMDWDDERFFKNQNDALACWEGRIMALSDNPEEPTVMSFDMVTDLKVAVLWDGASATLN